MTHKYSFEQELPSFGFGLLFNQNNSSRIDLTLSDNPVVPLSIHVPVTHNQYGISGFYRLQLKDVKSFLSYIKFDLSYVQNKSTYTYTPSLNQNQGYPVNDSVYTEYYISTQRSSLAVSSLSSFFLSVSVPLVYINKYIVIEPSVGLAVNAISYSYSYSYAFTVNEIRNYNSPNPQTTTTLTGGSANTVTDNSYVKYALLTSMNVSCNVYKDVYIQTNFGINNTSIALQTYF